MSIYQRVPYFTESRFYLGWDQFFLCWTQREDMMEMEMLIGDRCRYDKTWTAMNSGTNKTMTKRTPFEGMGLSENGRRFIIPG